MNPVLHARPFTFLIFPIYDCHILHIQYQEPLIRLYFQTVGLHIGDQYTDKLKLFWQLCILQACINHQVFYVYWTMHHLDS